MTDETQPSHETPDITVAKPGQFTVRVRERSTPAFFVLEVELQTLRSNYSSPSSVFLGLAGGITVTLGVAALTVAELGQARPYFTVAALAFGLMTVYLAVMYSRDLRRANRLVDSIAETRKLL